MTEETPEQVANRKITNSSLNGWTWFSLYSIKITELPSEIRGLRDIEWFDLGDNYLSTLPPEIGHGEMPYPQYGISWMRFMGRSRDWTRRNEFRSPKRPKLNH